MADEQQQTESALTCEWYDVGCHASWLGESLIGLVDSAYEKFMIGVSSMIDLIPVPDFLLNLQPIVLSPYVSFFLEPFEIEYGIGIIVGSYTARFILRRIPGIG